MSTYLWFAAPVILWALAHLKTSRPDGKLQRVHPFRRIMQYIMPTRTESVVYYDAYVDAERLMAWLDRAKGTGADMTHLTVAAANIALADTPKMNRFVVGRRLYMRNARWLTFSLKRARMDREAQISTVKLEMPDGETFAQLVARINGGIKEERSGKKTRGDKEMDLFNFFPRPVLRIAAWAITTADYFNVLPGWFIATDPMFTSIFIANLGSLGMAPGYHHLFEYGTCPLFIMIGKLEDQVVARNGQAVVRPILHLRFTYDERIEDGLNAKHGIDRCVEVLSDPGAWLDTGVMWPRENLQPVGAAKAV
jgi:hypothetical protein